MKINKNTVKNIFETHFADEIDDFVMRNLGYLNIDDLPDDFIGEPEYFGLIAVTDIDVQDDIETEETADNTTAVSGTVVLEVEINGIDEEGMSCGSTFIAMTYSYSFDINDNEYDNLYMEWVE